MGRFGDLARRAQEAFGKGDHLAVEGVDHLPFELQAGQVDTIGYIDRKELYELIENVVDKCDDVANAVQSITAKHA